MSLLETLYFVAHFILNIFIWGPVDYKSTSVPKITWRRMGIKQLPEPVMTPLTNIYLPRGLNKLTYLGEECVL